MLEDVNNFLSSDRLMHKTILKKDNYKNENECYPSKCLFLDRDGVIIRDCHYLSNPGKVELMIGIRKLISNAIKLKWRIVLITNQSGIYRGFFSWKEYELVTKKMIDLFVESCPFDAIYANACGPNSGEESWRKPSPKMIYEAEKDLNIDLKKSIVVGDRLSDLYSGLNAGLKTLIHVKTGHGVEELESILKKAENKPIDYSKDFYYLKSGNKKAKLFTIEDLTFFPYKIFNENL